MQGCVCGRAQARAFVKPADHCGHLPGVALNSPGVGDVYACRAVGACALSSNCQHLRTPAMADPSAKYEMAPPTEVRRLKAVCANGGSRVGITHGA